MVALVATMRKFVIRLNSLVRDLRQKNPAIAFAFAGLSKQPLRVT